MWLYSQSSGKLWADDGSLFASGYSGHGDGKNNPAQEAIKNIGPIPRGEWVVSGVYDSGKIGPLAIKLEPSGHTARGRDYFRIHGDSAAHPGKASKGCIVLSRKTRQALINTGDKILKVIE